MTTRFTFTEGFYPDSSWIREVYFNENEGYVVLNLETDREDLMFKYTDVQRADVEHLVNAPSVGGEYNRVGGFKQTFGPGENLGSYDEVFWHKVEAKPRPSLVQNEWSDDNAKHRGASDEATPEVSLVTPQVAEVTGYQVTFEVAGVEKTHVVRNASFLREALDEFEDILETFGIADAEVTEVARLG